MAKHNPLNGERSRVRILFVDGDFASGELGELTQALTQAIKPAVVITRPPVQNRLLAPLTNGTVDDTEVVEHEVEVGAEASTTDAGAVRSPRGPSKARSYRKPQPVEMDMTAGAKAFTEFAAEKGPNSHRSRYLVAAAWLHDFAKIETVSADHIFTCYKSADWTFDIADPTATFRQLKGEGLGGLKQGQFSVNHLGLAEVKKMGAPA